MKSFITAKEVSEVLGIGLTSAYRIVKELNAELKGEGYITIPGKVSRKYFEQKWYQ